MVSTVRCDACKGRKQVISLGNMIKDCDVCDGSGYVSQDDISNKDDSIELETQSTMDKRQRARKQWQERKAQSDSVPQS